MYQGQKILLVDDDPAIIDLYSTVFKQAGLNYSVAMTGYQATEAATLQKPALVLLDIMLPDLNGLDVLRKLKSDPETSNTIVWMLSNLGDGGIKNTAARLGAEKFFVKALITPKQVLAEISALFV